MATKLTKAKIKAMALVGLTATLGLIPSGAGLTEDDEKSLVAIKKIVASGYS